MSHRQSCFAYAALLLSVITFAASLTRSTSGQQAAPTTKVLGRFHVAAVSDGNRSHLFITDSVTGQTWCRYSKDRDWEDWGSPIPAK